MWADSAAAPDTKARRDGFGVFIWASLASPARRDDSARAGPAVRGTIIGPNSAETALQRATGCESRSLRSLMRSRTDQHRAETASYATFAMSRSTASWLASAR